MKKIIEKVNSSYDLALTFFLLSGSLYFIYYSLNEEKPHYLLVSILVYFLGYFVRKIVLKVEYSKGFTETGLFFISFLLTAYLLFITGIDRDIKNYLPNEILIQSGSAFIFIILITFIGNSKKDFGKFAFILMMVFVIVAINSHSEYFNTIFLENEYIANFLIGFPLIYLMIEVFGINYLLSITDKSSQQPVRRSSTRAKSDHS